MKHITNAPRIFWTRVVEACVPMVRELGLAVTFTDLNFPTVKDKFDENGKLLDEAYNKRAADFLDARG